MSLYPVCKPDPHRGGRADPNFAAILSSSSSLYRLKYTVPPSLAMRCAMRASVRRIAPVSWTPMGFVTRRPTKRRWMAPELVRSAALVQIFGCAKVHLQSSGADNRRPATKPRLQPPRPVGRGELEAYSARLEGKGGDP
jgi:hypothetical protein